MMNKSPNLLCATKTQVSSSFKLEHCRLGFVAEGTIVYKTFNKFITHI